MDVVQRNIEKLGGKIDILSQAGKGATIILRIPLTLTIVEGLLVGVGESRYAMPIAAVKEAVQAQPNDLIKTLNNAEMLRLRNTQLPIIRLHELHQLEPRTHDLTQGTLIVVEEEKERIALFVDQVLGQQQVVVKGLPKYLGKLPHLAGCTILGDGEIGLILDLNGLVKSVKESSDALNTGG